ncbi:class I SAM-dependent methyltransferase [Geomonas subterranea]|uniref:class I SAM-dependent methyltransferase n=1 Tax=Geomonas subterranea TaxID=2847989 RepID=UPI001CD70CF8|nr:class I SAM-dependent methyltransferase [Geomonas fuzhouensis]
MTYPVNHYGDEFRQAVSGHGIDVASQRADDLDDRALDWVKKLVCEGIRPTALDAACGLGGQSIRLAQAGATVTALDYADLAAKVDALAEQANVSDRLTYVRADLRSLTATLTPLFFNVICCQRAIHYLRWAEAKDTVQQLASLLAPGGKLFISASGLASELGDGYPARTCTPENRFAPLADNMVHKHGIAGDVCLYDTDDLECMLVTAGLAVETVYTSPFGNVKGVAKRLPSWPT